MPDADRVFAVAWTGTVVTFCVHAAGTTLDLWGHRAAPAWIGIALSLATVGTMTYGFRGERHVE